MPRTAAFLLIAVLLLRFAASAVVPALPDAAKAHFGITRGALFSPARDGSHLHFPSFTLGDVPIPALDMTLRGISVRAKNFKVVLRTVAGKETIVDVPNRVFEGISDDGATTVVMLTDDGKVSARIERNGKVYAVQPADHLTGRRGDHVVFDVDDTLEARDKNTIALYPPVSHDAALETLHVSRAAGCGTDGTHCQTELALEADYEYYARWGAYTTSQMEYVVAGMNVQYEREVGITHKITTVFINTAPTQPYTSTDAVTLLNQFKDFWNANRGAVVRDTAHLFTGKEIDSSTIGIAWIGVICYKFYGYGLTQSDFNNNDASRFDLLAHELGHNWNANHCDCPTYTMNPYITSARVFGSASALEITTFRDTLTCLAPVVLGGCTTNADCDDGKFCNGAETCVSGKCVAGSAPCPFGSTCDETTRTCIACNFNGVCDAGETAASCPSDCCATDAQCDDGVICNGAEKCVAGSCVPGTPPCAPSLCNETARRCSTCNFNGVCDFGENCTTCPSDCIRGGGPRCGNSVCEPAAGENCATCPQDCPAVVMGKKKYCCGLDTPCSNKMCKTACSGAVEAPFCCGDAKCTGLETHSNCAVDCL